MKLVSDTLLFHGIWVVCLTLCVFSCGRKLVSSDYTLDKAEPVFLPVDLSKSEIKAAKENRLVLVDVSKGKKGEEFPVQLDAGTKEHKQQLLTLVSGLPSGSRFKLKIKSQPVLPLMKAKSKGTQDQPIITEGDQKVLQYNYSLVRPKEVIRIAGEEHELVFSEMSSGRYYEEFLKTHPSFPEDTVVTTAVYSVPRSDYIHPLFGLNGEILTRDWPDGGHPHHRGIFWAWPEVEYKGQRGDIYALQRVFSRPTGDIEFISGPVFAQINAENLWIWEDDKSIVKEHVSIRAYRSNDDTRIIDLRLEFRALEEGVTIATRFTDSYGGLNIRMQTPEDQEIVYFTGKKGMVPRRAWADFSGVFEGNKEHSGMTILQHHANPGYPGKWVEYPNLSWIQPTFPTPKTRYPLCTEKPLVLKYRFVVHKGGKPSKQVAESWWDAYISQNAAYID